MSFYTHTYIENTQNMLIWTHITINQHIKSDGVGFQQSAILGPVLHFKILCVPKDK